MRSILSSAHSTSINQSLIVENQGKYKYNAWKKQVDDGVGVGAAAQKYVAKVEEFKKSKGYDAKRTTRANGKAIEADKLKRYNELKK